MIRRGKYEDIFEQFRNGHQGLAENVKDWYATGPNEITIVLDDDTSIIYDAKYNDILFLGKRNAHQLDDGTYARMFAENLYQIMREKNISQVALSDATGIAQALLSRYMRGIVMPGVINLSKIARALDCSETRLLNFDLYEEA